MSKLKMSRRRRRVARLQRCRVDIAQGKVDRDGSFDALTIEELDALASAGRIDRSIVDFLRLESRVVTQLGNVAATSDSSSTLIE